MALYKAHKTHCVCPEKNHKYTTMGKCRMRVNHTKENMGFCWRCIKKYEQNWERSWAQIVALMNIAGVKTPKEIDMKKVYRNAS